MVCYRKSGLVDERTDLWKDGGAGASASRSSGHDRLSPEPWVNPVALYPATVASSGGGGGPKLCTALRLNQTKSTTPEMTSPAEMSSAWVG